MGNLKSHDPQSCLVRFRCWPHEPTKYVNLPIKSPKTWNWDLDEKFFEAVA